VLETAGVQVESGEPLHIHRIRTGRKYQARRWKVNGDWPGSAALLGLAAVVPNSDITVRHLYDDDQGEKECMAFYRAMGCQVDFLGQEGEGVRLRSPETGQLKGAAINGDLCTDAVLAMMGAAAAAPGESRFVQIRVLQFKECDRVREPLAELEKVYLTSKDLPGDIGRLLWFEPPQDPDTIHVTGLEQPFEGGIEVDGRGDHRVIMMLSIVALHCRKGLTIRGAEHVSKSFPTWFEMLEKLGIDVKTAE